jgi:hypothetical protein
LDRSEFEKTIYFEESRKTNIPGGNIGKINLNRTVFYNLAVFDITFLNIPDFSRAAFFKQPIIREKWNLTGQISKENESTFRFLKDYFLKQNNHQKELEYFNYEMVAKEKSLPLFQKIPYHLYDIISNYGNSVIRPLWWLLVSFVSFGRIFSENFCIKSPYFASFMRMVFPIIQADKVFLLNDLEKISNGVLLSQSIINSILLFLLLLGIRNKFKIK